IGFANIAMGVFGFAEIIRNLELPPESRDILKTKISNLMPSRQDLIDSSGAIARGTIIGSLVGILPGGGAVIASFAAYTFEKKLSKHPERFGRGAIQAWPRRKAPITRRRKPRSSRCSRSASRPTR